MLIDSHVNLHAPQFDEDRNAVIERARAAGVALMVEISDRLTTFEATHGLAVAHDDIWCTVGVHPHEAKDAADLTAATLVELAGRPKVIGIGECGLDFFLDGLDAQTQRHYFDGQLQLAKRFDLPLIVHARRAVEEVIARIKAVGGIRGVVHSFAGSPEQAQQLWKLDFMIGLGGPVTYPRANRLRGLAAQMPLEHLLLETDAPDQPDAEIRGQRNEPARLRTVLDCIAQLRGEPAEAIAAQTSANARRLFGLQA